MEYEYPIYPENNIDAPSLVLAKALFEDSNLELEWLWVADRVPTIEERRYCLRRAHYINPNNRQTQSELKILLNQQARRAEKLKQSAEWKKRLLSFATIMSARNG